MPTIHRESGFRVVIYPNDHEPAHVHVMKAGGEAKIQLLDTPDFIWVTDEMSDKDARKALEIVEQNQECFLSKWEEIHGNAG